MDYLTEQRQKALQNAEQANNNWRNENRLLWGKLITLSLTVLGFSFTLFSMNFLSEKIMEPCSISKYWLLVSWIIYLLSIFIGFLLLKKEADFQREEAYRQTLYAEDMNEIMDAVALNIKESKKDEWIALHILHGERTGDNDFWSEEAMNVYKENKSKLESYNLLKNPDDFYSYSHKKLILNYEKSFYYLIILATVFLMVSVISLIF